MARKLIIKTSDFSYHVYARSNNKEWFSLPLDVVYQIYIKVLSETISEYGVKIHIFVLMSNHFHMILSTPKANISEAMRYFMTETSKLIARTTGRINKIYGSRYKWTLIKNEEHYAHAFKYVARNPIKAMACKFIEDYKWCSILNWSEEMNKVISANELGLDSLIPREDDLSLWINEDTTK